jgi:hypothetical protein
VECLTTWKCPRIEKIATLAGRRGKQGLRIFHLEAFDMAGFLGNFKIGARLSAGFAIILLLLCSMGAAAYFQASKIYDGTEEIAENWLPSVQTLGDALRWPTAPAAPPCVRCWK